MHDTEPTNPATTLADRPKNPPDPGAGSTSGSEQPSPDPDPGSASGSDLAPTSSAEPLAPDDPRASFARAVATAGTVIDSVRSDQMTEPTPCDGMDVRLLVAHLVMVLRRVALAGRGVDPMTWPAEDTDVADDAWPATWRTAAHESQDAWMDRRLLARPTDLPWGTMSGADALGVYTNEVAVHTWDLAQSTGQTVDWDEQVLAVAWQAIRREIPVADRTPIWEQVRADVPEDFPWEDPFGPAVPVADDAPLLDRLLAWNGRTP